MNLVELTTKLQGLCHDGLSNVREKNKKNNLTH